MPQKSFYRLKGVKVTFQPNIGLDASVRQAVIDNLNLLLADEAVLSINTHKAEGDSGGNDVPGLKTLFDDQVKQLNAVSSEIVERVQIMGGTQLRSVDELIGHARLSVDQNSCSSPLNILADHEAFIRFLREDIQKCSELYDDQGTFALLVNILRIHEKIAWNLRKSITMEQSDQGK